MEIAKVSNRLLTQRVNKLLGADHSESLISQVRLGKQGSASLRKVVRDEVAAMLTEAAEAAKAHA